MGGNLIGADVVLEMPLWEIRKMVMEVKDLDFTEAWLTGLNFKIKGGLISKVLL